MNLIATKNFLRVKSLAGLKISNEQHPNMIHKGARFTIGEFGADDIATKPVTPEKQLVAWLFFSRSVAEATPENIKLVEDELAAEKRKAENHARLDAIAAAKYLHDREIALAMASEELSRPRR